MDGIINGCTLAPIIKVVQYNNFFFFFLYGDELISFFLFLIIFEPSLKVTFCHQEKWVNVHRLPVFKEEISYEGVKSTQFTYCVCKMRSHQYWTSLCTLRTCALQRNCFV